MCNTHSHTAEPVDAIVDRLNDPGVAAALVTVLDNAELLSTLVIGLSGLVERGDMIMDAVAESVGELKGAAGGAPRPAFPPVGELAATASALAASGPALQTVLGSSMTSPETLDMLTTLSEAATEGVANAQSNKTQVKGPSGAYKALKDAEVQRGLGVMLEIAKAIGRRY